MSVRPNDGQRESELRPWIVTKSGKREREKGEGRNSGETEV